MNHLEADFYGRIEAEKQRVTNKFGSERMRQRDQEFEVLCKTLKLGKYKERALKAAEPTFSYMDFYSAD